MKYHREYMFQTFYPHDVYLYFGANNLFNTIHIIYAITHENQILPAIPLVLSSGYS